MSSGKGQVKKTFPKVRLTELVKQFGGKTRDDAILKAEAGVESLRDDGITGILAALDDIEALLRKASGGDLNTDQLAR